METWRWSGESNIQHDASQESEEWYNTHRKGDMKRDLSVGGRVVSVSPSDGMMFHQSRQSCPEHPVVAEGNCSCCWCLQLHGSSQPGRIRSSHTLPTQLERHLCCVTSHLWNAVEGRAECWWGALHCLAPLVRHKWGQNPDSGSECWVQNGGKHTCKLTCVNMEMRQYGMIVTLWTEWMTKDAMICLWTRSDCSAWCSRPGTLMAPMRKAPT